MKTILLFLTICSLFFSCSNRKRDVDTVIHDTVEISEESLDRNAFPVPLNEIFKVHGGLENWQEMNSLKYDLVNQSKVETHTVSLKDRKTRIEADRWAIGFDGNDVWITEKEGTAYKGDPVFYYNLMFYFYAMPFVFADKGIKYEELKATELEGEVFEAIRIGYDEGVGNSSKDEYILYYDPETWRMTWLAYTVTYQDDEPNEDWRYIKYNEWQEVNGMMLPKTLTWYTVQGGKPVQARNYITFENVSISETGISEEFFKMPEGGSKIDK